MRVSYPHNSDMLVMSSWVKLKERASAFRRAMMGFVYTFPKGLLVSIYTMDDEGRTYRCLVTAVRRTDAEQPLYGARESAPAFLLSPICVRLIDIVLFFVNPEIKLRALFTVRSAVEDQTFAAFRDSHIFNEDQHPSFVPRAVRHE